MLTNSCASRSGCDASQPGDRFRVVTVPEPTSLACLVTLLLPFVAGPRGRRV